MLAHVLGVSRAWVLAHPEAALSADQEEKLEALLVRLERGEPLPYILGHWEFYGLDMIVTPDTLIPRPETELLVEEAMRWLRANPSRRRLADVGAGSGCIAISLTKHLPYVGALATDIWLPALRVAQENARRHAVDRRVDFLQADLLTPIDGRFDMICANLPYVPTAKLDGLRVAAWEPRRALDGGPDGLELIQRLLPMAASLLNPGGVFLLEIEASQGALVESLCRQAFPGGQVRRMTDLAGLDRLVAVQSDV